MPRMPFMGVRSSWLTVARNAVLASLAVWAARLAARRSDSSRWREVAISMANLSSRSSKGLCT